MGSATLPVQPRLARHSIGRDFLDPVAFLVLIDPPLAVLKSSNRHAARSDRGVSLMDDDLALNEARILNQNFCGGDRFSIVPPQTV